MTQAGPIACLAPQRRQHLVVHPRQLVRRHGRHLHTPAVSRGGLAGDGSLDRGAGQGRADLGVDAPGHVGPERISRRIEPGDVRLAPVVDRHQTLGLVDRHAGRGAAHRRSPHPGRAPIAAGCAARSTRPREAADDDPDRRPGAHLQAAEAARGAVEPLGSVGRPPASPPSCPAARRQGRAVGVGDVIQLHAEIVANPHAGPSGLRSNMSCQPSKQAAGFAPGPGGRRSIPFR